MSADFYIRASSADSFESGVPLGDVNTTDVDRPLFVTSDDCELFLRSDRPGHPSTGDVWQARRGE